MRKVFLIITLILSLALFVACDKGTEGTKTPGPTKEAVITAEPTDTPVPTPTPIPTKNLALEKPVTVDHVESNFLAEYAVDGDEDTRWSGYDTSLENSMENYDRWLIVDLEDIYTINGFDLIFEYLSVSFKLEVSTTGEEDSYETVYDTAGTGSEGPNLYIEDLEEVSARFVKFSTYLHEDDNLPSGHPYCSIYEFSVWGYNPADLEAGE